MRILLRLFISIFGTLLSRALRSNLLPLHLFPCFRWLLYGKPWWSKPNAELQLKRFLISDGSPLIDLVRFHVWRLSIADLTNLWQIHHKLLANRRDLSFSKRPSTNLADVKYPLTFKRPTCSSSTGRILQPFRFVFLHVAFCRLCIAIHALRFETAEQYFKQIWEYTSDQEIKLETDFTGRKDSITPVVQPEPSAFRAKF